VIRIAVPYGLSFKKAEEFVTIKKDWILKQRQRMKQYEKESVVTLDNLVDIDKTKAKRKLTIRLRQLAEKHGFSCKRVSIRNQKTRWGSCSHNNSISLNMKIIRLPQELMDYVLLHELVHTRIKNHSSEFWAELDRYVGNGKAMASKMRRYGLGLL